MPPLLLARTTEHTKTAGRPKSARPSRGPGKRWPTERKTWPSSCSQTSKTTRCCRSTSMENDRPETNEKYFAQLEAEGAAVAAAQVPPRSRRPQTEQPTELSVAESK